ncbi:MAG: glycosyltransferase [Peptococcaceae bacterium]|nr:glycosyltransferase [Peptococcaceae bacterium]
MKTGRAGQAPGTSIIIPCKNEGASVKMTVDSILAAAPGGGTEIIVVDDGSEDGCCRFLRENGRYQGVRLLSSAGVGAARARNLGASAAGGEYLIFCDAHITVPEGWPENLLETFKRPGVDAASPAVGSLENPAAAGFGQTWNSRLEAVWLPPPAKQDIAAVPLLPGGCLAVRAGAFRRVGGFDGGFMVWGHEDVEFSLKMWLFGFGLYVNPTVKILHLFRKKHPYPVTMDHFHHNLLRMAFSHFNCRRIARVLDLIEHNGGRPEKTARAVLRGGALEQRLRYLARRKYDDDWFMKKFSIDF